MVLSKILVSVSAFYCIMIILMMEKKMKKKPLRKWVKKKQKQKHPDSKITLHFAMYAKLSTV